ncbi:unnamed protein product [Orchesella dallaii]|uniref:Uncharacterized protein n=1 Tax=Orchesella dallaii TaxID=48710 RepID=A0ABP1RGZ7_9HEXA
MSDSDFTYVDFGVLAKVVFWSFVLTIVVTFVTMHHTIDQYKQEKFKQEKAAKRDQLDNATAQPVEVANNPEVPGVAVEIGEVGSHNNLMNDVVDEEVSTLPNEYL